MDVPMNETTDPDIDAEVARLERLRAADELALEQFKPAKIIFAGILTGLTLTTLGIIGGHAILLMMH